MAARKSRKPSKSEVEKLRKAIADLTREFWANYGTSYDFLMVGPPGPRPPPKKEITFLNLSSY